MLIQRFSRQVFFLLIASSFTVLGASLQIEKLRETAKNQSPIATQPALKRTASFSENMVLTFAKLAITTNLDFHRFLGSIRFSSSQVKGDLSINLAQFHSPIFVNQLTIHDEVSANSLFVFAPFESYYLTLEDNLMAEASRFLKDAKFYQLSCRQNCKFSLTHFHQNADFSSSRFAKMVDFGGTIFSQAAIFNEAVFEQNANFIRVVFKDDASFNKAFFSSGADFSYATIAKTLSFRGAVMDGILNFAHVKIGDAILDLSQLEKLHHDEKIQINLLGADISKIRLDYDSFELFFPINTRHEDKENTYTSLLKNFESVGLRSSYRELYSEYREMQYLYNNQPIINFLNKHFWNYGQNRERVFVWLGLIFLIYVVINAIFYRVLMTNYCRIEFLEELNLSKERSLHPLLRFVYFLPFSLILTFILFAGGFLKLGVTITNLHGRNFLVLCYLLSITIVGFMSLFFGLSFLLQGK